MSLSKKTSRKKNYFRRRYKQNRKRKEHRYSAVLFSFFISIYSLTKTKKGAKKRVVPKGTWNLTLACAFSVSRICTNLADSHGAPLNYLR